MKSVKVEHFADELEKMIYDFVEKIPEEVSVECPSCGAEVVPTDGKYICPNCSNEFKVNAKFD